MQIKRNTRQELGKWKNWGETSTK